MELLRINGRDYGAYIEASGYSYSQEERNAVKITDLSGTVHKTRGAAKDVVQVSLAMVPDSLRRQLAADTDSVGFAATYQGRDGPVTRRCATDTGVVATLGCELDDGLYWGTVQLQFYEL